MSRASGCAHRGAGRARRRCGAVGAIDYGPLALFAATHLFVEAAEAVAGLFALMTLRVAIVHICRLLDGMPLAIELAAGWVRPLSCTEIAAEIRQDPICSKTAAWRRPDAGAVCAPSSTPRGGS